MFRLLLFTRIMQLSDIWGKIFYEVLSQRSTCFIFIFFKHEKMSIIKEVDHDYIFYIIFIIGHCLWRKSRCYLRQQIWLVEFGYYSLRNGRSSASTLRHASNESTIFDSTESPSKTQIQKMEFKIQKFYRNRFGEGLSSTSIHRSASETSFCQRSA